jgi:transcriptional regulator with XRE-family HTH domain
MSGGVNRVDIYRKESFMDYAAIIDQLMARSGLNQHLRIVAAATRAGIGLESIEKAPTAFHDLDTFGERFRLTRIAYGRTQGRMKISQRDFCALVDLPPNLWNNAERASSRLGLDSALRIVERIGITLDWIYLGRRDGLPLKIATEISKLEKEVLKADRDWLEI